MHVTVTLSATKAQVEKLAKGQRVRFTAQQIQGNDHDFIVSSTEARKIERAKRLHKGIMIGALSAETIKHNITRGSGFWSSLKDKIKAGYSKLKEYAAPHLEGLGQLASEQGKLLAQKAADKAGEIAQRKLEALYQAGSDKIANYGKEAKKEAAVQRLPLGAAVERKTDNLITELKERQGYAPMPAPAKRKPRFPGPVGAPESFQHSQLKNSLIAAIRASPDIHDEISGEGFFSSLGDLAKGAWNGLKGVAEKAAPKLLEKGQELVQKQAENWINKKLGGGSVRRGRRGAGLVQPGGGLIVPVQRAGGVIPPGSRIYM